MGSPLSLEGKVAFVTGSTRGIGWACVRILAANGASVILNGVSDQARLDERVGAITAEFGVPAEGHLFNTSDPEAVKNCYNAIFKKHKRLDVLVNNAGVMEGSLLGMVTPELIQKTLQINVQGVILNMQYASRLMARNRSGSIINMSSIIGRVGNSGQVVYGASKAAVIGMTMSAAKELAPQNIRVNAVAPGFIDTDMVGGFSASARDAAIKSVGMGRAGTPDDVAGAVLFLASGLSAYVTGQTLGVDGGMLV